MIYVISGDDVVSSRTFLLKLKSQYKSVTTIDVRKEAPKLPAGKEFFTDKSLFILENFNFEKSTSLERSEFYDVVLWIKDFIEQPKWVDKNFVFKLRTQVNTFQLADFVGYGQEKQALISLNKLLQESTAPELIIGSLVRQLKLLSLAISGDKEKISKNSYIQNKVLEQSQGWNTKKIKKALLVILRVDLNLKKGLVGKETALNLLLSQLCQLVAR